jgi:hypothetical protein
MEHPCKLCLEHSPTKYHQCDHACYDYRLFIASATGEAVRLVAQQSADVIRHNQSELEVDDLD